MASWFDYKLVNSATSLTIIKYNVSNVCVRPRPVYLHVQCVLDAGCHYRDYNTDAVAIHCQNIAPFCDQRQHKAG